MVGSKRGKRALQISFTVSLLSLVIKSAGYIFTSSNTALSDALESIIHVLAVGFVYYGLHLSTKPADENHLYGHERIEFLSVGVEGTVIVMAGFTIIYQSIKHLITGYTIHNIEIGIGLILGAAVVNLVLGNYILYVGRQENDMIVKSNGKHTLTDVWTSLSVVITLVLIRYTNWTSLDSYVSMALALYIMYEGYKLLRYSVTGLMDEKDPDIDERIRTIMKEELPGSMQSYHKLRHRSTGQTTWIEFHALFDEEVSLQKAHEDATILERKLIDSLPGDVVVTIHLEPEETHERAHTILEGAKTTKSLDEFI